MSAPNIIRNINALKEILTLSGQDSIILGKYVGRTTNERYTPRLIPIETLLERIAELLAANPTFLEEIANALETLIDGENLGTGVEVFKEFTDGIFRFHTLVEGDGITIQLDDNTGEITITSDGGSTLYSNPDPTPTTIGGIPAGSTFLDIPLTQMWDMLLYPYQPPSASISSSLFKVYEVGEALPSGAQVINYTVSNPGNIKVQPPDVGVVTSTIPGAGTPATFELLASGNFSVSILPGTTSPTPTSNNIKLEGTNTQNNPFSDSKNVTWQYRRFHGKDLSTTLTGPDVLLLPSSKLDSSPNGSYIFPAGAGYAQFAFPQSWSLATTFKDSATNLDVAMEPPYTVSVTNTYGVTETYRVHRSTNILNGAITINVS